MQFDLLSEVLDLTRVRVGAFGPIIAGGHWAIASATGNDVSFCAVTEGRCCYFVEGMRSPAAVQAGDVLVLSYPPQVTWASDPSAISEAATKISPPGADGAYRFGQGEDFRMLGGGFHIGPEREGLFRSTLPRVIHIRGDAPEATPLTWLIDQLNAEMRPNARPGRTTIVTALAQMLFAHSLRAYLVTAPAAEAGWLRVFGSRRLMNVLASLHADPAHRWTLAELAQRAGMSRSALAAHFRDTMGMPPLAYLANWRMRLAMDSLRAGFSIAEAAAEAGYGSERAFGAAFRRATSTSPGAYRKSASRASHAQRFGEGAKSRLGLSSFLKSGV